MQSQTDQISSSAVAPRNTKDSLRSTLPLILQKTHSSRSYLDLWQFYQCLEASAKRFKAEQMCIYIYIYIYKCNLFEGEVP